MVIDFDAQTALFHRLFLFRMRFEVDLMDLYNVYGLDGFDFVTQQLQNG